MYEYIYKMGDSHVQFKHRYNYMQQTRPKSPERLPSAPQQTRSQGVPAPKTTGTEDRPTRHHKDIRCSRERDASFGPPAMRNANVTKRDEGKRPLPLSGSDPSERARGTGHDIKAAMAAITYAAPSTHSHQVDADSHRVSDALPCAAVDKFYISEQPLHRNGNYAFGFSVQTEGQDVAFTIEPAPGFVGIWTAGGKMDTERAKRFKMALRMHSLSDREGTQTPDSGTRSFPTEEGRDAGDAAGEPATTVNLEALQDDAAKAGRPTYAFDVLSGSIVVSLTAPADRAGWQRGFCYQLTMTHDAYPGRSWWCRSVPTIIVPLGDFDRQRLCPLICHVFKGTGVVSFLPRRSNLSNLSILSTLSPCFFLSPISAFLSFPVLVPTPRFPPTSLPHLFTSFRSTQRDSSDCSNCSRPGRIMSRHSTRTTPGTRRPLAQIICARCWSGSPSAAERLTRAPSASGTT